MYTCPTSFDNNWELSTECVCVRMCVRACVHSHTCLDFCLEGKQEEKCSYFPCVLSVTVDIVSTLESVARCWRLLGEKGN